ncbi:MAG: RimK family alpha-L-glutamate ligase [Planctomycetes bacterium]|nr:RimK family alpha-L-glutamate ligase [Planctomycetota bacterium]NUQ33948.1 RimK family alpha-L-glutamate ligase [Planctomycetaceae bacterium]
MPMGPLILSRDQSLYSTRRLVEAARASGRDPLVADPTLCSVQVGKPARVTYEGALLEGISVVLPRLGYSSLTAGINVLRALELSGVPCLNSSQGIELARNKYGVMMALAGAGMFVPRTVLLNRPDGVDMAFEAVGGAPLLLKFLDGSQGVGVVLAESERSARSMADAMLAGGKPLLVQEGLRAARDVRVLVIDGRAVAAMERSAKPGEFRANIHRGATARSMELDAPLAGVAAQAANAVGLAVAGVDLVRGERGDAVIDVNASPGLEGIEQASGKDLARMIVDSAISLSR